MATTFFEDKLSGYLAVVERVSTGYYIANGVSHQNLEKTDVNEFIVALKTIKEMFDVAFKNKEYLVSKNSNLYSKESFWNDLIRQKNRFDHIEQNQLDLVATKNNVKEICNEIKNNNCQVIDQLKKSVAYNLTILPVVFFKVLNKTQKVDDFSRLQSQLLEMCTIHNQILPPKDYSFHPILPSHEEILSWFAKKEKDTLQEKEIKEEGKLHHQQSIENEKQMALNEANIQIEQAQADAKRVQEEALKLMEEMQKKYGI